MFVTVGSAEWNELLKRLKNNDATLTQLHLDNNQIGDSGAQALSEILKKNRILTQLYLYLNQVGASGAKGFSEALKVNRTLTLLHLGYNLIGDSGAQALSEALKENRTLTQFYFNFNQIRDSGAQALSEALKVNRTLSQLDLNSNQIGDSGAKDLSEALKVNRTLTQLYLSGNDIRNSGAKALSEALKENHTLTLLDLGYNQIEDSNTIHSINNFLARNNGLIRERRDQFIQTMIVLACDTIKTQSHSIWRLLPKEVKLHIISFITFHPWESIDKTPPQIADCVAYIFDNTDALKASLKEAIKTKQPFKVIEKPFNTTTNKFPFFFKPLPAQQATSEREKTYHSPYERQNQ